MPIDDEKKETLLARWLSGEITPEEKALLEQDPDFDNLKGIIETTDTWAPPAYDKDAAFAKLKRRQENEKPVPQAKVRRLGWARYAVAAMLVVAFGIFVFRMQGDDPLQYETNFAQNQELDLPDGSSVDLNHASSFEFVEKGGKRLAKLSGEAFFDVEKGNTFSVETPNGTVTVLGTSFNVYARDNHLEVACYSGKVRVESQGRQAQDITKGLVAVLTANEIHVKRFGVAQGKSWDATVTRLEGVPLKRVIEEMELRFGLEIDASGVNTDRGFSGSFLHKDIETAARMVFDPMNLDYSIEGKTLTLSDKN